ncbi:gliding motility-associated C-terminal domain-containing protein [Taibaiella chishuiensis]|uniref:Gliding motility-associated-like protein n=1 Tax=Taibaiella chishuiensis TaxID=1434707 RepID=A0A2P8CYX1_9BACT|nr:gliding motility-associated C-terminal domain-containing protein [Taibaiella chishuiensis]PSK90168.1 gliding motility-associated-like protein [Taibaiella chishuiensis]
MKSKHIKGLALLLLLLAPGLQSRAQFHAQRSIHLNANSNWFFGEMGLNLKTTPATVTRTEKFLETMGGRFKIEYERQKGYRFENMIPVSHPETGALRFIAIPYWLYDRDLEPMPNGNLDVFANGYAKYMIVAPFIRDPDRYYVFSITGALDLAYSVVDMKLNNGRGDVVPGLKNILIRNSAFIDEYMELVDVVPGNNCDLWLITTTGDIGNTPYTLSAYHITASGVDTTPVISYHEKATMWDMLWDFKVSPNRESLAFIALNYIDYYPRPQVHFFKFDPDNGVITEGAYPPVLLSETEQKDIHGCFTPDNTAYIVYKQDNSGDNIVFHKYELNENMRHTSSLFPVTYPVYNRLKHSVYTPPIIFLKPHGNKIYFNIPEAYSKPDPHDLEMRYKLIGQITCTKLGVIGPSGNDWQQVAFDPAKPLSESCRLYTNNDVVYPYLEMDTIPSVYFDTVFCREADMQLGTTTLKARPGFSGYIWNDGTTGDRRQISTPGKYWVYYKGGCNNIRVDTFIYRFRSPIAVLPPDTVICDQRFPVTIQPKEAGNYLWEDQSIIPERNIYGPGTYSVTFEAEGCPQHDTIRIGGEHCPCNISVPNAFSPNNDGLNDYFKPTIALGCVPAQYSLLIYNRWGQMIYKSNNEFDRGWDGTYNGAPADMGNYFYELRFKTDARPEPYYHKGALVLIR